LIGAIKRPAFRSIAAAERMMRTFSGGAPSLDAADLAGIRNFLIPSTHSYLGAAVHETPLIEALRLALPNANIVAAGSGVSLEVYQHHPGLTRVVFAPDPNRDFRRSVRCFREVVRGFGGEPWCALFTVWNSRSRMALAMMLSGNGVRAGFTVAPPLVHLPLSDDREASQIVKSLWLPGLLGHTAPLDLEPRIYFSEADLMHARRLLEGGSNRPDAVLITRTSGGQPTKWPDERFVAVAKHLIDAGGCRVVLPGTAADAGETNRLAGEIGREARSVAGKTTIPQLAALCALSDIAIAVDTGAMHVARTQQVPLVILAPGWQNPIEWMPVDKPWARIMRGPSFPPPPPANYTIQEVSVEEVSGSVDELLRLFPPSPSARQARVERSLVREAEAHTSVLQAEECTAELRTGDHR